VHRVTQAALPSVLRVSTLTVRRWEWLPGCARLPPDFEPALERLEQLLLKRRVSR
jgi:hypothetical protein